MAAEDVFLPLISCNSLRTLEPTITCVLRTIGMDQKKGTTPFASRLKPSGHTDARASPSASAPSPSPASTPTTLRPTPSSASTAGAQRSTPPSPGATGDSTACSPCPSSPRKKSAPRTLGLNCLNFHRNLAKEDVLRSHDRLGVFRYMEPGAGKMAIGKLPAHTAASANTVGMEKPASGGQVRSAVYVYQVRRDGERVPLASVRDRVLPAKRTWRGPQAPRHACGAGGHAGGRPLPVHRAERRLCRSSADRRASLV